MRKVYIRSAGIVSPIGNDAGQCLQHLTSGISGILPNPDVVIRGEQLYTGKVALENDFLTAQFQKDLPSIMPRAGLLSLYAAALATGELYNSDQIDGIVYGASVGIQNPKWLNHDQDNADYADTDNELYPLRVLADKYRVGNLRMAVSTACSTGANVLMTAARLIASGRAERILCGASESLSEFTIRGFDSLLLYDREPCKPMNQHRAGLNLGEASAFFILESESAAEQNDTQPLAQLSGWGNACDAYHMTASSPQGVGAVASVQQALHIAGLKPEEIDAINLHGTGTENNDSSEVAAMEQIFKDRMPYMSSTKSYTGHTLAAAGAIEGYFSILSLRAQMVFPTLRLTDPIASVVNALPTRPVQTRIQHILSNSFGFGGNCSALIFSEC